MPEAAPREPRPGTAARKAAADITASVVDDLAPAPAPLTPWEESLVGDAFKAPKGSRFKDRDLLAGVDVYAHMRDHAARGRPVSTITGRLQPYRGEATGRPPKFVPLEVGKARRRGARGGRRTARATAGARGDAGGLAQHFHGASLRGARYARRRRRRAGGSSRNHDNLVGGTASRNRVARSRTVLIPERTHDWKPV